MTFVQVRIPATLRDAIDAERGDVPRERWVRRTLEAALSATGNGHAASSPAEAVPADSRVRVAAAVPAAASPRTSAANGKAPQISRSAQRMAEATGRPVAHLPNCKCPVCKPGKAAKR